MVHQNYTVDTSYNHLSKVKGPFGTRKARDPWLIFFFFFLLMDKFLFFLLLFFFKGTIVDNHYGKFICINI